MLNRFLIGAGIGVAALVLAGCGGDESSDDTPTTTTVSSDVDAQDDPAAFFEEIATATEAAGTYRLDMTMKGGGADMDGTALVVLDGDETITRLVMEMPLSDVTANESDSGVAETTVITTAATTYMQYPPEAGLNEPGQWVTIDNTGALGDLMAGGTSTDVVNTEWLASLGDDLDITVADGGEVDGVPTQEVSLTLTGEQLAAASENNPLGESAAGMIDEMDYVLKVGEDMLVRELSIVAGDAMSMTASLYDYGVDETVEIPADDDTVSFEDLMGGAIGDLEGETGSDGSDG